MMSRFNPVRSYSKFSKGLILAGAIFAEWSTSATSIDQSIESFFPIANHHCNAIRGRLEETTQRLLRLSISEVPAWRFLTESYFNTVRTWSPADLHQFAYCMRESSLPFNLNGVEVEMFARHPSHPLFRRLDEIQLPKGYGALMLSNTYGLYFVIDVVRAFRTGGQILRRKDAHALRQTIESVLEQSLRDLPIGVDGHLMSPIWTRIGMTKEDATALLDRPLYDLAKEVLYKPKKRLVGDDRVLTKLFRLAQERGVNDPREIPTRYYMTKGFYDLTLKWAKARRLEFRSLMARLDVPINLNHDELDAFERNPQDRLFASLDSLPEMKRYLNETTQVDFVIDAVRALDGLDAHPFKDDHTAEKRAILNGYLAGRKAPSPILRTQLSGSPQIASDPKVSCTRQLSEFPDEEFLVEYERRRALGRFRLTVTKP